MTLGDALRLPGWPAADEIIFPDEVGEAREIIADQGGPSADEEAQS